jgi:phosphoribosylformimino-5-aminoimidazole carboxamide ribotide isomerase
VARDGLTGGPNVEATAALARDSEIPVIASGGVGSLDDIAALRDAGIPAVVVGRAIYEGRFSVADAVRTAHGAT